MLEIDEPNDYQEALRSGDSKKWMGAMDEEMNSHEKNGT